MILQVDDTEVIGFLLQTEIIPLCLRTMENGSELSKTVSRTSICLFSCKLIHFPSLFICSSLYFKLTNFGKYKNNMVRWILLLHLLFLGCTLGSFISISLSYMFFHSCWIWDCRYITVFGISGTSLYLVSGCCLKRILYTSSKEWLKTF